MKVENPIELSDSFVSPGNITKELSSTSSREHVSILMNTQDVWFV